MYTNDTLSPAADVPAVVTYIKTQVSSFSVRFAVVVVSVADPPVPNVDV